MGFFNRYPYTNAHEINLDWIIGEIKKLHQDWSDFKVVNSIRFYGNWDIRNGYPRWSLVSKDNKGYISVDIVPVGIDINNEGYWKPVADYSELLADMQERITILEKEVEKNKIIVTPQMFGAVGDGITDDTKAFQDMMDSVYNDIVIPYGTYAVTTIRIKSNKSIIGDGYPTILESEVVNANAFLIQEVNNIIIEGLKFSHKNNTFNESGRLVNIIDGVDITLKDCIFEHFTGDAIQVNQTLSRNSCTRIKILDSRFENQNYEGRNGISVLGGNYLEIARCTFLHITHTGMPGAIDIEPHQDILSGSIHDINVHDNNMTDIGGNAFHMYLGNNWSRAKNIIFMNNTCIGSGVWLVRGGDHDTIQANEDHIIIHGNYIVDASISVVGFGLIDIINNRCTVPYIALGYEIAGNGGGFIEANVVNNTFIAQISGQGILGMIRYFNDTILNMVGNTFISKGNGLVNVFNIIGTDSPAFAKFFGNNLMNDGILLDNAYFVQYKRGAEMIGNNLGDAFHDYRNE